MNELPTMGKVTENNMVLLYESSRSTIVRMFAFLFAIFCWWMAVEMLLLGFFQVNVLVNMVIVGPNNHPLGILFPATLSFLLGLASFWFFIRSGQHRVFWEPTAREFVYEHVSPSGKIEKRIPESQIAAIEIDKQRGSEYPDSYTFWYRGFDGGKVLLFTTECEEELPFFVKQTSQATELSSILIRYRDRPCQEVSNAGPIFDLGDGVTIRRAEVNKVSELF